MSKFLNIIVREQLLEQSGSRSTVVHHLAFHRKYELPACQCLWKSWRQDSRKQWNQSTLNFLCETWSHQTLNFLCEVPQTIIFSVRSPRHWTFPMRLGLPDIDWLREDYSLACDWSDSLWYLWLYLFLCDIIFVCFSISSSLSYCYQFSYFHNFNFLPCCLALIIMSTQNISVSCTANHLQHTYSLMPWCQTVFHLLSWSAPLPLQLSHSHDVLQSPFSWRTSVALLMTYYSLPSHDVLQSSFSWCTPVSRIMTYFTLPSHVVIQSPFSWCNSVSLLMTYFTLPSHDILHSPVSWCTSLYLLIMYFTFHSHVVLQSPFSLRTSFSLPSQNTPKECCLSSSNLTNPFS